MFLGNQMIPIYAFSLEKLVLDAEFAKTYQRLNEFFVFLEICSPARGSKRRTWNKIVFERYY